MHAQAHLSMFRQVVNKFPEASKTISRGLNKAIMMLRVVE